VLLCVVVCAFVLRCGAVCVVGFVVWFVVFLYGVLFDGIFYYVGLFHVACCGWLGLEEFVVQVYAGGRVTVPLQLRKRFDVEDGDYVRLVLVEVLRENDVGKWVGRKLE